MSDDSQVNASAATTPVRGSLRLTINASSPQVTAGSDFSIFVVIQNPFDIPITVHQVQTHIPVELVDVNGLKLEAVQRERNVKASGVLRSTWESVKHSLTRSRNLSGIAIAVGTEFDPTIERDFVKISAEIVGKGSHITGVAFNFPQNPSPEELDRLFRRLSDYKKGLIPTQLQPGDSLVKQFVLRTRHWLFFTPLTHRFQIQVNYTGDGVDHTDTIAYEQSVRSTISAMTIGAVLGAALGTLVKTLSSASPDGEYVVAWPRLARALAISTLAAVAVVVAFARKSTAQPIVSIEDFWGGVLIGFSVGFFGIGQFTGVLGGKSAMS
jgi:hypothetical protein